MKFQFPQNFYWGTATAAHQVEGGNVNNDIWLLEHLPGGMFVEPSGDAIDHYHLYREDIALLAELGFNLYRFSLEWSRIEPEEGEFSYAALEHYRRMLAACHEHCLTPMLTYHHFSSPRWLMRHGGWAGEKTPDLFARFCERAARHLGDLTPAACTLNEANIGPLLVSMGFLVQDQELQRSPIMQAVTKFYGATLEQFVPFIFAASPRSQEIILSAHRKAVEAIKSGPGSYPVGVTLALFDVQAEPGGEEFAAGARRSINDEYLEAVRGDDYVGVQTYSRIRFGPQGFLKPEPGVELTQMGYEFYPEALEATIRQACAVAGVPVIVTENGLGTDDDTRRVEYIRRALQGVWRCLQDGLDVRGYTYWSAFDNFEWMSGYKPTFGLVAVNRQTQQRLVKPSARWLGQVARNNGFDMP